MSTAVKDYAVVRDDRFFSLFPSCRAGTLALDSNLFSGTLPSEIANLSQLSTSCVGRYSLYNVLFMDKMGDMTN